MNFHLWHRFFSIENISLGYDDHTPYIHVCKKYISIFINKIKLGKTNIMKKKKRTITEQTLKENFKRFLGNSNAGYFGKGNLNEFRTESGQDQKDFMDAVEMIYQGAKAGDEMVDEIGDELGDFYDAVQASGDKALINAYADLRELQYDEPEDQAAAAEELLKILGYRG